MKDFEHLRYKVRMFQQERPVMDEKNKDPEHLLKLLSWEVEEAKEALSEQGVDSEEFANELADILIFLLSISETNDVDVLAAAFWKIVRNNEKYPKELFQDGADYEKAVRASKEQWKAKGGDSAFQTRQSDRDD